MLARLAHLGGTAPRRVLPAALLLLALAAVFGAPVASHLSSGGFTDPSAQSTKADALLSDTFHAGDPNLVFTVSDPQGVGSAAARRVGTDLARHVAASPWATQVTSYWTAPRSRTAALRSDDARTGLVVARVVGDDTDAPKRAAAIATGRSGVRDGVTVRAGGIALTFDQVNHTVKSDLAVSEAIAVPLTTLALILIFGSLFAALLPVAVGIAAIVGTLAVLRAINAVTDVSIFALNMTTALGLALAIDYSLLVVNRYREEIRAGRSPEDAVTVTVQTAGRTVLFSALTVALSLAAMLVFPLYFLRSFAYAGIAVVLLATVAALVLLPAVLTLVGPRIDSLDLRRGVRRLLGRPEPTPKPLAAGLWYRFAHTVMRRSLPVGVLVVAFLVALGLPFLRAQFGFPDDRVLPPSASSHQVGDDLRTGFATDAAGSVSVVLPHSTGDVAGYARALSQLPAVTSVTGPTGSWAHGRVAGAGNPAMSRGGAAYLTVATSAEPNTPAADRLLRDVRSVRAPAPALYTGTSAQNRDSLDALADALPWALLVIVVSTLVVLFLFTGSVVLPVKALVLNTLSLSATFGAMVWVFQEGHLHWLFPDLTVTGHLEATMPPLMFCIAFGLSMDYEVFLLSRIREAWLASDRSPAANVEAVAQGLGRTGRIVTAAATLMAIVFAAIAGSSVSFIMLFGTGLTLAVLMDATVVRGMLVPAFMRLAGRWNWWAPRPLARLHQRIGWHETPATPAPERAPEDLVPA